jgi:hypothetical protein
MYVGSGVDDDLVASLERPETASVEAIKNPVVLDHSHDVLIWVIGFIWVHLGCRVYPVYRVALVSPCR